VGLRKISLSLHYHAPRDFEIFSFAPLPRATGLSLSLSLNLRLRDLRHVHSVEGQSPPHAVRDRTDKHTKPYDGSTIISVPDHNRAQSDLEKFRSRSTTTRRGLRKKFDLAPLPRAAELGKNSISLHYHAPRDFEIFDAAPLPRAAELRKISISLHYHAPRDFEIFDVAPLPRAEVL